MAQTYTLKSGPYKGQTITIPPGMDGPQVNAVIAKMEGGSTPADPLAAVGDYIKQSLQGLRVQDPSQLGLPGRAVDATLGAAQGLVGAATNPENRPLIGAAIGAGLGAATPGLSALKLTPQVAAFLNSVLGAGAGGYAGGVSHGDTPEQAFGHVAPQMGLEMTGQIGIPLLARGVNRALDAGAQWAERNSLSPYLEKKSLATVADPRKLPPRNTPVTDAEGGHLRGAATTPHDTPGEAVATLIREKRTQGYGRTGSTAAAKTSSEAVSNARTRKVSALDIASQPERIDALMSQDQFTTHIPQYVDETLAASTDPTKTSETIRNTLEGFKTRLGVGRLPSGEMDVLQSGMPRTEVLEPVPLTPKEWDVRLAGIGNDLRNKFTGLFGEPVNSDAANTLKQLYRGGREALESTVPDVRTPNAFMHQNIPIADALSAATLPRTHVTEAVGVSARGNPYVRASALGATPMSFLAQGADKAANFGLSLESARSAAPRVIPNSIRLAWALLNGQGEP